MVIKVNGLVIKTFDSKESDRYLIILTKEYGKIMVRAAGVRNYKSKHMTATQLFSYSEFTLMKTQNFCKINEAEVIENFYQLRLDIKTLALASYMAEVVSFVSFEGKEDEDGVLNLVLNTLFVLSYKEMPLETVRAVFELKLMSITGFMPNMTECENCGVNIEENKAMEVLYYYFDFTGGNLICEKCFQSCTTSPEQLKKIDTNLIKLINFISTSEIKRVFSFRLDENLSTDFSRTAERYFFSQMARGFKTLDYYKSI